MALKFNLSKFLEIVASIGPLILFAIPGAKAAKIGPLIPLIVNAIGEAQQIKGATGAEKKAHVLAIVEAGVATANATGKVKLDATEVAEVASNGIDAVIGTVHVISGAKVVKTEPPPIS